MKATSSQFHQNKPSQKFILVIDGLWGSGKTTLAKRLAKSLNAPLLVFDEYRESIYDSGEYTKAKDHPELDQLSRDQLLRNLKAHLDSTNLVIIEWDFEHHLFQTQLLELASSSNATFVTIHLFAKIKVRIARALLRLLRGERHHVHEPKHARLRKIIGLLLPTPLIPGPRDKASMALNGPVIRQDMTRFGEQDFVDLNRRVTLALGSDGN